MLRNGEVVGYPDRDLLQNTEALIAMMVGREIDQLYTPRQRPAADNGATPLLSVRQLSDGRQLQDLSFDIQPGEIVGVAGLLGAGRDVLVDLLYGLRPAERGTIHLEGGRGAFVRRSRRSAPAWRWCHATAAIRG